MDNFNLKKYLAEGKLLKEEKRSIVDYDNRDGRTTELFLDNGDSVEVDVIELYNEIRKNNEDLAEGKLTQIKEFVSKDLDDRNQPLYDELVAGSGKSDTMEGEMLRAINRIVYRYYNDGDEYTTGYGTETVGPAHSFLVNANTGVRSAMNMIFKNGTNYEETIEDALEHILSHIEAKQGKYTKNTAGDMFDYDAEFEDDTYEEDDYDDYYDDEDDY
mgnify:CR=1 FL=1